MTYVRVALPISPLFFGSLFPICSQFFRLRPFSETVFDGHTGKSCPSSVSRFKVCVETNFSSGTRSRRISSRSGELRGAESRGEEQPRTVIVPRMLLRRKRRILDARGRQFARISE